jgi:hypothetical protein
MILYTLFPPAEQGCFRLTAVPLRHISQTPDVKTRTPAWRPKCTVMTMHRPGRGTPPGTFVIAQNVDFYPRHPAASRMTRRVTRRLLFRAQRHHPRRTHSTELPSGDRRPASRRHPHLQINFQVGANQIPRQKTTLTYAQYVRTLKQWASNGTRRAKPGATFASTASGCPKRFRFLTTLCDHDY